jgi:hypothetical protein
MFKCEISLNNMYSANKFAVTGANEFANTCRGPLSIKAFFNAE